MRPESDYLCVGGIELVHGARVLSYLARGLAGSAMAASVGYETSGSSSSWRPWPYTVDYKESYFEEVVTDCAEGFNTACLQCACPALLAGDDYVDPATDDAPWWQAPSPSGVDVAADFLGVLGLDITLLPAQTRTQQPRMRFGGTPSPQRLLPRVMQVTAQLWAASPRGMEWGQRWLTDVLTGCCGDGTDVTYLPYCPPFEQPIDDVYRVLADAVLVDGPVFSDAGHFPEFRVCEARFQLASSAPWLCGVPQRCDSKTLAPGASMSCLVETEDWGGSKAVVVTLGGSMNGVNVRAVPLTSDQDCPVEGTGMACSEFTVTGTQAGDTLIVDSSRHAALLTDISSKLDVSAVPYLTFTGPFPWIEAPPCTRLCVTVTNGGSGSATVVVDTVVTEL